MENQKEESRFLDGHLLAQMAQGGAALLRSNADEVNKLNVFPVPDGDTGDNMRMTIESGIAALERIESDDLAEVMRVLSRGMLLGARGNSGVILSQFFAGIAAGLDAHEKADAKVIGHALSMGVKQAYSSVMTPTEGTILTVARESVEYAVAKIDAQSTIRSFFADLVKEMYASLQRTPERLAALKEAGVIDVLVRKLLSIKALRGRPVALLFRVLIVAIRSVPFLIYGLIFIRVSGPGAFTGVLTLAVCSIGLLSKRFTEAIESLDFRAYDALRAMGVSLLPRIRYAVLPQLGPAFSSAVLYRFDVNIREASVLGLVGAGGIGAPLIFAMNQYAWNDVSAIFLGFVLLVWLIDAGSARLRTRRAAAPGNKT